MVRLNTVGKLFFASVAAAMAKSAIDAADAEARRLPNGADAHETAFALMQCAKRGERARAGAMARHVVDSITPQMYFSMWTHAPRLGCSSASETWSVLVALLEEIERGNSDAEAALLSLLRLIACLS